MNLKHNNLEDESMSEVLPYIVNQYKTNYKNSSSG